MDSALSKMPKRDLTQLMHRIKFIREHYNISKAELARRLEISSAYVTALESGKKTTISRLLSKIMQHEFGISRKWLLAGKGEAFPSADNRQPLSPEATDGRAGGQRDDLYSFERLLSEISATYINIPIERIESVLRDDFRRLNRVLGYDACILFICDESPTVFTPIVWHNDENDPSNRRMVKWIKQNPILRYQNFPYTFEKWYRGKSVEYTGVESFSPEASKERSSLQELGLESCLSVPLSFAGSISGVIAIGSFFELSAWPEDLIPRLRILGEVFINAIMRKRSEEKLHNAFAQIKQLKERFEADYLYLSEEIRVKNNFEGIVGQSDVLNRILQKIRQVGPTNTTVLILGETGTGKGLLARTVHDLSSRKERPLMQVNCAALAPSLIESELFGHEKGAFTGAVARRLGRFEAAMGTSLFLDEIGDLPLELQAKLLRVLEEGEFERLGGNDIIHTDIRLIAATSRDLEKEVNAGRFRSDLWYRLNVFPIIVPPLRERLDDIPLFVEYFVEKLGKEVRKRFQAIPLATVKALQSYSWPGNIRELKNVIERAIITSSDGSLRVEIPQLYANSSESSQNLRQLVKDIERENILKTLEDNNWIINGKNGAARRLGFTPSTLRYQMKKLNIKRPRLSK